MVDYNKIADSYRDFSGKSGSRERLTAFSKPVSKSTGNGSTEFTFVSEKS
jgi:hypothetical protein